MKVCPYCAEQIQDAAIKCRFCGTALDTADARLRNYRREYSLLSQSEQAERRAKMSPELIAAVDQPIPTVTEVPAAVVVTAPAWSPGVAALLSLIIPGAGQMYKGNVAGGLIWLVCVVIGYFMLIVPGLFLHLICIVTAASGTPPAVVTSTSEPARQAHIQRRTPKEEAAFQKANRRAMHVAGILALTIIALWIGALTIGSFREAPAPAAKTVTPVPAPSPEVKTSPSDDIDVLTARFGLADIDTSSETETPRPPIVTRFLTFKPQHVRAIYRASVPMGSPPPYAGTWKLIGFTDPRTNQKIDPAEAVARLSKRKPIPR